MQKSIAANKLLILSSTSERPVLSIDGPLRENSYMVERFQSAENLLLSPSLQRPCIILLELGALNDVDRAIRFLDSAGVLLQYVKIVIYCLVKVAEIRSKFSLYAIADFIDGPIPDKTVIFKISLLQKIISQNEDDSTDKINHLKQALFQKESLQRLSATAKLLKAKGPSSASGEWLMDPNSPNASVRWRWISKDAATENQMDKLEVVFCGKNAPIFDTKENLWLFESAEPSIEHYFAGTLVNSTQDGWENRLSNARLEKKASLPLDGKNKDSARGENILRKIDAAAAAAGSTEEKSKLALEESKVEWKIKDIDKEGQIPIKQLLDNPPRLDMNWNFSAEEKASSANQKVYSSLNIEYVKKIKEEDRNTSNLQYDSKLDSQNKRMDEENINSLAEQDAARKRLSTQDAEKKKTDWGNNQSQALAKNHWSSGSGQQGLEDNNTLSNKNEAAPNTQAKTLQESFKKINKEEVLGASPFSQSIRLVKDAEKVSEGSKIQKKHSTAQNSIDREREQRSSIHDTVSGSEKKILNNNLNRKSNEIPPPVNRGKDSDDKAIGVSELREATSIQENNLVPEAEAINTIPISVEGDRAYKTEDILLAGVIFKDNKEIKIKPDPELEKILLERGVSKNRKYFLLSLEELGDDNSTWERVSELRVYISGAHKYYGIQEVKSALPLWVYPSTNMPQFIETRRMWLFLDKPPYMIRDSHDLPSVVFQYLIELMELYQRGGKSQATSDNNDFMEQKSPSTKKSDQASLVAEAQAGGLVMPGNLSQKSSRKDHERDDVLRKHQSVLTRAIVRILNFFKF